MTQVDLHYGARTDVGLVREVNEDAYLAAPPVFVVADGMGGHDGGDVASAIVVEELGRLADTALEPEAGRDALAESLAECQRRIADYGREQAREGEWYAGTTAVVGLLVADDQNGPQWLLANLGDSRAYRFAEGELVQVSTDHSVVQELVDAGQIDEGEAATHPERHVITRALGGPQIVEADYFLLPAASVQRLLLCSDGISGLVASDEIAAILRDCEDPRDATDRLVEAALAAGGKDNATAVVVDVVGWGDDASYDADQQRANLEQKLGSPHG